MKNIFFSHAEILHQHVGASIFFIHFVAIKSETLKFPQQINIFHRLSINNHDQGQLLIKNNEKCLNITIFIKSGHLD